MLSQHFLPFLVALATIVFILNFWDDLGKFFLSQEILSSMRARAVCLLTSVAPAPHTVPGT